ncbi:MAG: hypothetical protein ACRDRZ_03130, partial [Pseudonocardiaceae bacterium]
NRWEERDPVAAARLVAARTALAELAEAHQLPVQNLLQPDLVRRLCWAPPSSDGSSDRPILDREAVDAALVAGGARAWQRELTVAPLTEALRTPHGQGAAR